MAGNRNSNAGGASTPPASNSDSASAATGTPPAGNTAPAATMPATNAHTAAASEPLKVTELADAAAAAAKKADPGEGYRFKAAFDGEDPIYTNNPRYARSLNERGAQVREINPPKRAPRQ